MSVVGSSSSGRGSPNAQRAPHSANPKISGVSSSHAGVGRYSPSRCTTRPSLQLPEPLGQQAPRHPRQPARQLVEPGCADEQVAHHQQRPPVAQHLR